MTLSLPLLEYGVGTWDPDHGLGYHRVIIQVKAHDRAVFVHVPWRRHDNVNEKGIHLEFDTKGIGKTVLNYLLLHFDQEYVDLIFEPIKGPGLYALYFLPTRWLGRNWFFPTYQYEQKKAQPKENWLKKHGLWNKSPEQINLQQFPQAAALRIESMSEFHSFYPMEVTATQKEVSDLKKNNPVVPFLLFFEPREYPIRMKNAVPVRWIEQGPTTIIKCNVSKNEFFVFQIGLFACFQAIEKIQIEFEDLKSNKSTIQKDRLTCFNLGGTNWLGQEFSKNISVSFNMIQALWIGIDILQDQAPGIYRGSIKIGADNCLSQIIPIECTVEENFLEYRGHEDLKKLARLNWLNSTIGINDEVFKPYIPVKVQENQAEILGRKLVWNAEGLPQQILSYFSSNNMSVNGTEIAILANAIRFLIIQNAAPIQFKPDQVKILSHTSGSIVWECNWTSFNVDVHIHAKLECDGYLDYAISLTAKSTMDIEDIQLIIPYRSEIAKYMMGLGVPGGIRPSEHHWKWEISRANNMWWIGTVNAGLQCKLKHITPDWALTDFNATGLYRDWNNEGKSGCHLRESDANTVLLTSFTGPQKLTKETTLHFNFALMITPLKTLDKEHWNWRYYHNNLGHKLKNPVSWIQTAQKNGAKIINVHHGNMLNPHINYPFYAKDVLQQFVRNCSNQNIRVKIYYTLRELTIYTAELWALRSLGSEVFTPGLGVIIADQFAIGENSFQKPTYQPRTGHTWLKEHFQDEYDPAWHQPLGDHVWDISIRTSGLSRWHNYYIEGLNWLVRHLEIKGLYLDGIGYDRVIMKRVRKVLDAAYNDCLIDFHSGNNFDPAYGLNSPINQYLEHFPFIDSLWMGEGFEYEKKNSDYWLVEISGIPFGLFGEMLHGGGNPFRGMIYGMTSRLGWTRPNPQPFWELWDRFGIQDADMIGYWDPNNPVKNDNKELLITTYKRTKRILISIASWARNDCVCHLDINWNALGMDSNHIQMIIPKIGKYQRSQKLNKDLVVKVKKSKGVIIWIDDISPESK